MKNSDTQQHVGNKNQLQTSSSPGAQIFSATKTGVEGLDAVIQLDGSNEVDCQQDKAAID